VPFFFFLLALPVLREVRLGNEVVFFHFVSHFGGMFTKCVDGHLLGTFMKHFLYLYFYIYRERVVEICFMETFATHSTTKKKFSVTQVEGHSIC